MTEFADAWADAEGDLDGFGGELVEIRPQIASSHQRAADPDRPVQQITARYMEIPATEGLGGKRYGERLHGVTSVSGNERHFRVSPGEMLRLGFSLRKNDHIVRLSRSELPAYAIELIEPTDLGTILLKVSEIRGPA